VAAIDYMMQDTPTAYLFKDPMEATVFKSNGCQLVHHPKPIVLPENIKRVDVVAIGDTRIISPAGRSWDSGFDGPSVMADFMAACGQACEQVSRVP